MWSINDHFDQVKNSEWITRANATINYLVVAGAGGNATTNRGGGGGGAAGAVCAVKNEPGGNGSSGVVVIKELDNNKADAEARNGLFLISEKRTRTSKNTPIDFFIRVGEDKLDAESSLYKCVVTK